MNRLLSKAEYSMFLYDAVMTASHPSHILARYSLNELPSNPIWPLNYVHIKM